MATVDRNIVRLAFAELKYEKDTPYRVILDEAVELAKQFSTEDSGAFVNGVLDKLRESLRPETVNEKGAGGDSAKNEEAAPASDPEPVPPSSDPAAEAGTARAGAVPEKATPEDRSAGPSAR
jgi:N utilization substance protein B